MLKRTDQSPSASGYETFNMPASKQQDLHPSGSGSRSLSHSSMQSYPSTTLLPIAKETLTRERARSLHFLPLLQLLLPFSQGRKAVISLCQPTDREVVVKQAASFAQSIFA